MAEIYRSLYSVIPARVRDDRELRPNAKLLYGELSTLAQAEGYCWATNAYLAELFGLSPRSIELLLRQLKNRGHIQVEVERDEATNEVFGRKIWICGPPGSVIPPPRQMAETSPPNSGDPPRQIAGENNNNINNNITPYNPPKGDAPAADKPKRKKRAPKDTADWKPERFEGFYRLYPLKRNRQKAIQAWDKLRPDDDLIAVMGRALLAQMESEEWRRGIGIPYPSSWLNGQRWTDQIGSPGGGGTDGEWSEPEAEAWDFSGRV